MDQQTNAVATRGPNALAHSDIPRESILRQDILVPYIILGQGQSDAVQERKVNLGDIYRSTNGEVLGSPDKPIDVVFLHYPKSNWVIEQKTGDKFVFRKVIPRNASNETMEWNFWADQDGNEVAPGTKNGSEWRRVKQLMVFGVLPNDIDTAMAEMAKVEKGEAPDPSKALTPVLFSFRSNSFKAGKEVCTFFTQAESMNVPIWWYKVQASDFLDKNDKGSFYVWKVDRSKPKPISLEHRKMVEVWAKMIASSADQLRTDDQADIDVTAAPEVRVAEDVG